MALTLRQRFESKYVKTDSCWLWIAATYRGYGRFQVASRITRQAHRIAYELYKGIIPDRQIVRHSCDVPNCVNPEHLILGTQQDNMTDRKERGRWKGGFNSGEQHPNVKLTQEEVDCIRISKESSRNLADFYQVSHSLISFIKNGKRWNKHDE